MAGEYSGGSAEWIYRHGQHAGAVVCMAASGVILGGAFPSEVHVYSECLPVVPAVGHHSRSTSSSLRSSASYSLSPTSFLFFFPLSFYLVLDLPLGLLPGSSNLNLPPLTHPLSLLCWTLTLLPTVVWLLPSFPTATLYHQLDSSIARLPCSYKSTPALFSSPQLSQTLSQPKRNVIRTTSIFFSDLWTLALLNFASSSFATVTSSTLESFHHQVDGTGDWTGIFVVSPCLL